MKHLRHVVLVRFFKKTTPEQVKLVEEGLNSLPSKIPTIKDYEWGLNNSPEDISLGFSHCYLFTFSSTDDRDAYLVNPAHLELKKDLLSKYVSDVAVVDYWAKD